MESDGRDLGTLVEYEDGGRTYEGFVVTPRGLEGRGPTVLLTHDWSGPNQGMRERAAKLAELGYVCFLLDLYGKGIRGDERGDNAHLMNPLLADRGELRRRVLAGLRAALGHPSVAPEGVAVLGYCFGGLCALDLARAAPRELKGAVSIHGVLKPPQLGPQPPITASILLLHGWEDPVAPQEDVLAIARELTDAAADWQLLAFGHARHAFTFAGVNIPELGLLHDPAADRRSWLALRGFLAEVLGPPMPSARQA